MSDSGGLSLALGYLRRLTRARWCREIARAFCFYLDRIGMRCVPPPPPPHPRTVHRATDPPDSSATQTSTRLASPSLFERCVALLGVVSLVHGVVAPAPRCPHHRRTETTPPTAAMLP